MRARQQALFARNTQEISRSVGERPLMPNSYDEALRSRMSRKKRDVRAISRLAPAMKSRNLERTMNRILVGGCFALLFGCGARTDYFIDQEGAGGQLQAGGNGPAVAGAAPTSGGPGSGGAPSAGGAPNVSAGAPAVGGRPNVIAGAPGMGGAPNVSGGAPGGGGRPNVGAGAPGAGGVTNVAGAAASAGSGATSGIVEACQVIAGSSCQRCLCTTCSSQIVECFSNFGCALVLACAQTTGCQGVACYTAQTCRPVIDQFGGLTGKAMRDVLSLLTYSLGSQNSCSCN
jgi:hypothetical protein